MNRRITFGFISAMVLIASGFFISFYSYNQYGEDIVRIRKTYDVISALQNALSSIKDIETSTRGYVITNDPSFLEPYNLSLKQLPKQIEELRKFNNENKVQLANQLQLEKLIQDKVETSKVRLDLKPSDKKGIEITKIGKHQMDLLRQQVAKMINMEEDLMEVRSAQAARTYRNTILIIFALSLLTFLVLVISYNLLEQELLRRQQNEDQLHELELKLKGKIRQLEASNEELERFAFVASHDLQEPLRKIQSFTNLIVDRHAIHFDNDSMMFMNKISNSAQRMSRLIKDLLNFSRISSNSEKFDQVKLNDVVGGILDDHELRIKSINALIEVGTLPVVEAVASQMDHLFNNLISNALKFVRADVQPVLRIQSKSIKGDKYSELNVDQTYCELTVEDNGIGFDEKYVDLIFNVFQRLHGNGVFEGTGIGLAICKRVVMNHHGYITVRSKPNIGTTFVVVLPESQLLKNYD